MPAPLSCCGYPNEYVSEMSTPHRQPNDEVKGGRERRLRSDAIRAALRCGADAPGLHHLSGWGNCAALRGAVAIRSGRVAPDGAMANSGGGCVAQWRAAEERSLVGSRKAHEPLSLPLSARAGRQLKPKRGKGNSNGAHPSGGWKDGAPGSANANANTTANATAKATANSTAFEAGPCKFTNEVQQADKVVLPWKATDSCHWKNVARLPGFKKPGNRVGKSLQLWIARHRRSAGS
jgi:hypothetical protein